VGSRRYRRGDRALSRCPRRHRRRNDEPGWQHAIKRVHGPHAPTDHVASARVFEGSKRACVVAYMSRCTSRVQRTVPPMDRPT
jgi:hypothetical protein